jgi:uncharacterized protein YaaN involved in tellurite resistance
MEQRPELDDYKDEIHHPNGSIEDVWRHNDYVEDLNKYVDHLEQQKRELIETIDNIHSAANNALYKLLNK